MGYIATQQWYKKDFNARWLFKNNFRYSKQYSDLDSDAYIYTFPIYKYKFLPLYECMLILYEDNGEVIIKVQDRNKNPYPQFYYDSQGNHTVMIEKMEKVILKELDRLGIEPLPSKEEKVEDE